MHYNFEPDNVLFDQATGCFGVIDFDDAIQCWYALDLVRAQEYAAIAHALSEPVTETPDWMEEIIRKLTHRRNRIQSALEDPSGNDPAMLPQKE